MSSLSTDPLRQELDTAIKKRDALRAELSGIKNAQEKISARISELRRSLNAAEDAFSNAKEQSVTNLVSEAMGETHGEMPSMRKLRADLAAVEDEIDAAKDAKEKLEGRQKNIDQSLMLAKMNFRSAFNAVVGNSNSVSRLLEETKSLEEQIIERMSQLCYLVKQGHLNSGIYNTLSLHPVVRGHAPPTSEQGLWEFLCAKSGKIMPPEWQEALALLDQDASTPLPNSAGSTPKKNPIRKLMGGS
ncbi:hypothetical protein [Acetobacter sp. P1H12_c]|uniref:hypothetical protein n=1 Tax=Acetobacter sp. P1H12_c TaxID=2762621 RepID=UPI001C045541|nr:hypothetical protein [Acetobacter sp. P1H12_c]